MADSNGFLRGRLRAALSERAAAASPSVPESPLAASPVAAPAPSQRASSPEHDDWYLRRGRFSRGPVIDGPWQMELDEVTRWLDAVAMSGTIVELGAGMGWWSTLLADKGELWLYDADGDALDAARRRLMAHGLLAHLHERDPLAEADKAVDVVFAAFFLGAASMTAGLADRLSVVRGWLKPGGSFVFLEVRPNGSAAPLDGPAGPLWPRDVDDLAAALGQAGLEPVEMRQTRSAFVMGRATAAT
jgi:SAM-dependent methyltransferase